MFDRRRLRGRKLTACPPDQVGNAKDSLVNLTPTSQARAEATRAGWAPWLSGQAVPLIWERQEEEDPCGTFGAGI
jgi:hypothetical protein